VRKVKIAIVVSDFNYDVTSIMLQKALDHAKFLNVEVTTVIHVPGTFETPLAVKAIISKLKVDAIVVLGAVIQGETKHDEVVANNAARKLMDLAVEYIIPVSLGIIGPGASRSQALERAEEYATRAVESAIKAFRAISGL
jgi:6,7-dimethyl-8-ribityllumazine synthase